MRISFFITVTFLMLTVCIQSIAQSVGHMTVTYTDPARSNRSIANEIYYPATSAGESTPFATGQFPVIVFGHGFVMGYNSYLYFKDAMVPLGYIVVYPTTEGSTSPVHADFGADLAFLINKMQSEGANSSSPFYTHVGTTSAVMGHSMGGGSAFLACENNTTPTCMVTFAAATTTPSSITAAANVSIPALVLSGSADCVADPTTNQLAMYNALASTCKAYVSIIDGSHCYFGDYNFNCTLGESFCDPVPPLARADQQDVTLDFVQIYLNFYLKGNTASWAVFVDSLASSSRITYQLSCPTTGIVDNYKPSQTISIWPNPADANINVEFETTGNYTISIVDAIGKQSIIERSGSNVLGNVSETIDISSLKKGFYFVEVDINGDKAYSKVVKE
jgi:pimeloyl-ACP methyl ester carboxylesterase